jgi:hypothetical protein
MRKASSSERETQAADFVFLGRIGARESARKKRETKKPKAVAQSALDLSGLSIRIIKGRSVDRYP